MRKYIGTRTEENVVVEVVRYDIRGRKKTRNLRHIPFHSPNGFGWGYQGSGPADLALAILVDYLKERPPRKGWLAGEKFSRWSVDSRAFRHHQYFKRDFMAKFEDEWELSDAQIEAWLKEREADGFTRDEAEAKVGKWVRTRAPWVNIEAGTIGKVVKAELREEVWQVVIQWDWPKTWHDRLSRYEYEQYLEEVEGD